MILIYIKHVYSHHASHFLFIRHVSLELWTPKTLFMSHPIILHSQNILRTCAKVETCD